MSDDCRSYSESCSDYDSDSGLAELEARLYSQYHYQGDFDDDQDDNEFQKEEEDIVNVAKCNDHDAKLDLAKIEVPRTETEAHSSPTKTDTNLRRNPFHGEDIDSDDDSSEDEGIIAVSSDTDNSSDVESITISSDDDNKFRKNKPNLNLVNNTKDITRNNHRANLPQISFKKYNRKKRFVADFGSDFSDNFLSSDLEESDDESENMEEDNLQFNFSAENKKLPHSLGIRFSELNEINDMPAIVPRKWSTDMNHFYSHINKENLSVTTDDMVTEDNGKWHLTVSDRYASTSNKRANRYYTKTRCSNCNQIGHYRRDCPDPIKDVRCSMCGGKGHRDNRCPRTCCLGCGAPSQMFRSVCYKCKLLQQVKCKECGMYGHKKTSCPDLWRRFHCTTNVIRKPDISSPRNNKSYKSGEDAWCCKCGEQGHLVDTCTHRTYLGAPITVCSYEPVKRLQQDDGPKLGKSNTKRKQDRKSSFSPPPKKRKRNESSPKKFKDKKCQPSFDRSSRGKSFYNLNVKKDKINLPTKKPPFLDNNLLMEVANFSRSKKQAPKHKKGHKNANKGSCKEQHLGPKNKTGKIYQERKNSKKLAKFNNSFQYKSKKPKNTHIFF